MTNNYFKVTAEAPFHVGTTTEKYKDESDFKLKIAEKVERIVSLPPQGCVSNVHPFDSNNHTSMDNAFRAAQSQALASRARGAHVCVLRPVPGIYSHLRVIGVAP